jgi:imidazolonepropionase-like amidohydrolase
MTHTRMTRIAPLAFAALVALAVGTHVARTGAAPVGRYAIRDARIVTMAGAAIEKGVVVMSDGLIEDVGTSVAVPTDAVVVDGTGMTVYPGFIDMANSSAVEVPAAPAGAGRGAGGDAPELEDLERARRVDFLKPDFEAARYARFEGPVMRRLASAGITSVLATPPTGLVRGQSALINVMAPPEDPLIGVLAENRRGLVVVKAPVAQHISFTGGGRGGGGGYPGALLGTIAFVRQAFYDAQWQRDAHAYYDKHSDQRRTVMEPVLDALGPALERRIPAAFDANLEVEIARALALAKEFNLDPIIVGGSEAGQVAADIKAARGRVIYSLNFPTPPEPARGRGGRSNIPEEEALRVIRARINAPKVPAVLAQAGVPFAFTSGGLQDPARFMRNAARTVREGALPAQAALEAMTLGAARIAGVDNRLGAIQKGRIANLVIADGDWLETATRIRHVFVDGRPVDIDIAPPETGGRGGRGRGPAQGH